ncbi:hypothetical protein QAD02_009070 [Eretmocerus hayati]|uniref:Uncharacterized protein n=1 Tax=Eretmocerus hayati TaxID=131215 RepID=A0ACC2NAP1_9HYME|nr:hypothetical protein QAD02_009070 [Eretmocerus hayati]
MHNRLHQPQGLALRDMTRNILPRFANNASREFSGSLSGLLPEMNHRDANRAFTYTGWTYGETPSFPPSSRYLWSNNRHIEDGPGNSDLVSLYYTLRGHYGLAPCLSKSPNPVYMLPHPA